MPLQHLAKQVGVLGRRPTLQVLRPGTPQAHVLGIELVLGDGPILQLEDARGTGGGQFIEPVFAVEDERPLVSQVLQHADHQWRQRRSADTQRLAPHATGIGQWAEDVEDRPDPQLAPCRARVAHRRVKAGRETEADARRVDATPYAIRTKRDVDAEGLEDVGAAAAARGGAVAMLGHWNARARGDQRRRRGDIESPGAIAPGPAGIDRPGRNLERRGMGPHRLHEARHLVDGFAFGPQGDQESGELARGDLPRHHLVHHVARLVARQRLALEQLLDRVARRHGRGYW